MKTKQVTISLPDDEWLQNVMGQLHEQLESDVKCRDYRSVAMKAKVLNDMCRVQFIPAEIGHKINQLENSIRALARFSKMSDTTYHT